MTPSDGSLGLCGGTLVAMKKHAHLIIAALSQFRLGPEAQALFAWSSSQAQCSIVFHCSKPKAHCFVTVFAVGAAWRAGAEPEVPRKAAEPNRDSRSIALPRQRKKLQCRVLRLNVLSLSPVPWIVSSARSSLHAVDWSNARRQL